MKRLLICLGFSALAWGQVSNGSDGAYATNPNTNRFDPVALGLDADGDNVYHFTSVTINHGLAIEAKRLRGRGPLVWLVSGNVTFNERLFIDPSAGGPITGPQPVPGPGAYSAGQGPGAPGVSTLGHTFATTLPATGTCAAVHAREAPSPCNAVTSPYGSASIFPLIGGSGGANTATHWGGTGGAAIRIVANSIIFGSQGYLSVSGGAGAAGSGHGSGGAIHLAAKSYSVSAAADSILNVNPGGRVRLDGPAAAILDSKIINPGSIQRFPDPPPPGGFNFPLPKSAVLTVSIGGTNVPADAEAALDVADHTFSGATPAVRVLAKNIPPGTSIKMVCKPPSGAQQSIELGNLAGTFDNSSTTPVNVAIQGAITRCSVSAQW